MRIPRRQAGDTFEHIVNVNEIRHGFGECMTRRDHSRGGINKGPRRQQKCIGAGPNRFLLLHPIAARCEESCQSLHRVGIIMRWEYDHLRVGYRVSNRTASTLNETM